MTQFIPQGYGTVVISMSLTGDPEPMAVTLGIKEASPLLSTPDEIAAAIHGAFQNTILTQLTSVISLTQVEVYLQRDGDSWDDVPPTIGVHVGSFAGSEVGNSAVQNTAYLCHKRSSLAGRRGRGRFYLPGVAEGDVSPTGAVSSGRQTTLNAELSDFLDAFDFGDLAGTLPVILHGTSDPLVLVPPIGFPDPSIITSMNVDPIAATQRRRLRR